MFIPKHDDPRMAAICRLLVEAERAVRAQSEERPMDGFASNEEFADFIQRSREDLQRGRSSWLTRRKLMLAFASTSDWDDCVGDVELGDRVFSLLDDVFGSWR